MTKMKKLISILLIFYAFVGCDSIPDGVVDVGVADYKVLRVTAPSAFAYSEKDSILHHSITFNKSETVESVSFKLVTYNGQVILNEPMVYEGSVEKDEKTFNSETVMSKLNFSGNYELRYSVKDNVNNNDENVKKVAAHKFFYNNGQDNEPPVISNLLVYYSDEDKQLRVDAERDKDIIFSTDVSDPNGLNDIKKVSFKVVRPDGSVLGILVMFDDGDPGHGDEIARDGTYSLLNSFEVTSQTGDWRFEFVAEDQSSLLSNKIDHILEVK